MVKEILEPKYLCEYPGCWERYKSWQEAKDCQDQGLIGPNLKPGLVLGKSGYRMIPIKNEDKDNETIPGLPEIGIYILVKEIEPKGHERQYDFCNVSFGRPSWMFDEEGQDYISGKKHIWKFENNPISINNLESKLTYNWVKNNSLIKELSEEEFEKIKEFIETHPEAERVREILKENNIEELRGNSPYIKKVLKRKWDEDHS
ncbi:MAG TPA: hypothetical protein VJB35_05220 [Candidatus Nanoarchaeia archaeon]|nr:hypothetical protein [Candidatus Nanoarchaeia archaeon]